MEYLLQTRAFLDAKLIFWDMGIAQIAVLVTMGIGIGLFTARQLWHRSRSREDELILERDALQESSKPSIIIETVIPPVEQPLEAPAATTDPERVHSRSESVNPPKFISQPEVSGTKDTEEMFTSQDEPVDSADRKPERIVYIMDVSKSLKDPQFELCKAELTKALSRLSESADYQVIFFSGATWFAHQRMVEGGERDESVVIGDGDRKLHWRKGFSEFVFEGGNHNLPSGHWRKATPENIEATLEDIREVQKSFGTTWHLPFMLAMNLESVPTRIYFLTDGETAHQDLVAEGIVDMVKSKGGHTKIYTRALMVPKATVPLRHIARETAGEYLLINFEG